MSQASQNHYWLPSADNNNVEEIDALCLGTGRFLRSVLVPALVGAGLKTALIQTRGRSFFEFMQEQQQQSKEEAAYPVDTVLPSGEISTSSVPCYGAFSLGKEEDKHALVEMLPKLKG